MKQLTIVLLFSVIAFTSVAQSPQRIEAMRMVQNGDNFLRSARFEDAIAEYTNAITTDNSYADAYMKRSAIYSRLGRTTEAKRDYERATMINPSSSYVLDDQAKGDFLSDRYWEGLKNLEHAIAMDPDNSLLRDHRVDGYILTGEYLKAKNELEVLADAAVTEEAIDQSNIDLRMALIAYLEGDMVEARNRIELVLDQNDIALAYDVLGLIDLSEKNLEIAIDNFNKAIDLNPDFALAIYNKAVAYKMMGKEDLALRFFDQAIDVQLSIAPVYFARGLTRRKVGDYKGAIDDYTKMNQFDTVYFNAVYNRAFTYKMIGDYENALIDANKAIEIDPRDAHAWMLRGKIHMLFRDYSEAIIDYTQAMQLDSEMVEAQFNRGLAKILDYRIPEGCDDLEAADSRGFEPAHEALGDFCGP